MSKRDNDLNTTGEAARKLKVSAATIIKWCNEGEIKCLKTLKGHRRIEDDEIVRVKIKMGLEL